jgi:predicted patatin/cPLA2 family phospholipase
VEQVADPRYAGLKNLLQERSWFGMRFLFETLPDELLPFRYDAFQDSLRTLVVGVTDCATGGPAYFEQRGEDGRWFVTTVLRASSSLPVLSPPVDIRGRRYSDGGVSDPIPVDRSIADGHTRNVVVLTQNAGYRKEPQQLGAVTSLLLARHPGLRRALAVRHERYNAELEQAGRAFVFRPVRPLIVGRLERDVQRLDALYRQGYEETAERIPRLREWLAAPEPEPARPGEAPGRPRPKGESGR